MGWRPFPVGTVIDPGVCANVSARGGRDGGAAGAGFGAVIAVPARSEAQRIGACLDALLREVRGADAAVVVLANNCCDDTAGRARAAAAQGAPVFVEEVELAAADAHAGGARRRALAAAAARLRTPDGLLLTTDADSRVAPGWLAANRCAMQAGADAVCGVVALCPDETRDLAFPEARRREARYATLQAELGARIDPQAHDPWPNHLWAWGASLAVRADVYVRAGGVPDHPLAEDRAFVARLNEVDARVRHALDVRVVTSARREGRAPGGLAALVDAYAGGVAGPCDAALEPALAAARRASLRRRLRSAWRGDDLVAGLASRLGLAAPRLEAMLTEPTFGLAWRAAEWESPRLGRTRLHPADLARETARAERLLARLRPARAGAPADSALAAAAELW